MDTLVMRGLSQAQAPQSTIASLRALVNAWRRREGWSRETVVQQIVEAHRNIGGEAASGIRFESDRDAFRAMQTQAERVFRWLDDESKDTNLLPVNFLRSLLCALPLDLRLRAVDSLLEGTGLHADVFEAGSAEASLPQHLRCLIKECGEAEASLAHLFEHDDAAALAEADRELAEAAAAIEAARATVAQRRAEAAPQIAAVRGRA